MPSTHRKPNEIGITYLRVGAGSSSTPQALIELLKAHQLSTTSSASAWLWALEVDHLLELGASMTDLKWLVDRNFAIVKVEATASEDHERGLSLLAPRGLCMRLTDAGARAISKLVTETGPSSKIECVPAPLTDRTAIPTAQMRLPTWDDTLRELRFDGSVIKQFRWPALNQERVLKALEEDGWPESILDPLPPKEGQSPSRRLQDTVKNLNRNQRNQIITFRASGSLVRWHLSE